MKFYTKFDDETIEHAIKCHTIGGYNSIEEAIADCATFEKQEAYVILNEKLETVYVKE